MRTEVKHSHNFSNKSKSTKKTTKAPSLSNLGSKINKHKYDKDMYFFVKQIQIFDKESFDKRKDDFEPEHSFITEQIRKTSTQEQTIYRNTEDIDFPYISSTINSSDKLFYFKRIYGVGDQDK